MTDEEYIVPDWPLNGSKVELAAQTYVSVFEAIAEEFMRNVFEMEPEDYLITDESRLSDFVCFFDRDLAPVYRKIEDVYGLAEADLPSTNLHEIFGLIHKTKCGAPT